MPPIRRSLLREAIKNSSFRTLALALLGRRLLRRPRPGSILIECYPGLPGHKEVIWKIALLAGMRLARPSAAKHADEVDGGTLLGWSDRPRLTAHALPTPDWAHAVNARVLLHVDGTNLECERGISRDDEEPTKLVPTP